MEATKYFNEKLNWTADYVLSSDSFRIFHGPTYIGSLSPHAIKTMPDWKPVRSVLFVSEDKLQVFDGEEYFIVDPSFIIIKSKASVDNIYAAGVIRYKLEENARRYVLNKMVVFSLSDITEFVDSEGLEAAEKMAEQRIFPASIKMPMTSEKVILASTKPIEESTLVPNDDIASHEWVNSPEAEQEFLIGHDPVTRNTLTTERSKPQVQVGSKTETVEQKPELPKPDIHEKLLKLKTTTPLGQKIISALGESERDFWWLKRAMNSRHPKDKITDGDLYKELDGLEVSQHISKRHEDGKFVYSVNRQS